MRGYTVKQAVVWIVLALLLATGAFAAEDFVISGTQQPDALRCLRSDVSFAILNSGDAPSAYSLGASGVAAEWTLAMPLRFALAPGASQTVSYSMDVPCDAPAEASLDWTILTDAGLQKQFSVTPGISTPQNIQLAAGTYDATILPCQTGQYTIGLTNPSSFEERYTLAVTNPSDLALDIAVGQTSVTLKPNETQSVGVGVKATDCAQSGETSLLLRVISQKTDLQADYDLPLVIEASGIAEVGKNVDRIVAGYVPSGAFVSILNKGTTTEKYAISVDGPGWVRSNASTITLTPGQASGIGLVITPTRDAVSQGDYPITVSAVAASTKAAYTKDVIVRVYEPSWLTLQFTEHILRTIAIIVAAIILLLVIIWIIIKLYRYYTSDEYKKKREETRKAKEARRAAKLKAAEEKRKLKDAKRKAYEAEREKRRKAYEAECEKKRLAKEQKRKEAERAQKERIKQRLKEIERAKAAKEREAQKRRDAEEKRIRAIEEARREQERERKAEEDRRVREYERQKREESLRESKEYFERAKAAAERDLKRSHYLIAKKEEPRSRAWLVWLAVVLLFAAIIVGVIALPFLLAYGLFVLAGIVIVVCIIILIGIIELIEGRGRRTYRFASLRKKEVILHTRWRTNVGEVAVRSADVTGPCKLTVRRSSGPLGFVSHEGPAFGYCRIDGRGVDSADIKTLGIRFAVTKGWLRRHKVAPETVKLSRYDAAWRGMSTEMIGEDAQRVYYAAEPDCLGTFAIVGRAGSMKMPKPVVPVKPVPKPEPKPAPKPEPKPIKKEIKVVAKKEKPKPKKKGKPWPWVLIICILVLLLVGGALLLLESYAPASSAPYVAHNGTGIPPQVWPANTQHQLNLSAWFKDPDGDPLAVTYTPAEGIVMTSKGLLVTFEPTQGFIGNRTVTFTVADIKGGKAASNTVPLVVYGAPALTPLETVGQTCKDYFWPILIGVVLAVIIILLIEYRAQVKKFLEED